MTRRRCITASQEMPIPLLTCTRRQCKRQVTNQTCHPRSGAVSKRQLEVFTRQFQRKALTIKQRVNSVRGPSSLRRFRIARSSNNSLSKKSRHSFREIPQPSNRKINSTVQGSSLPLPSLELVLNQSW